MANKTLQTKTAITKRLAAMLLANVVPKTADAQGGSVRTWDEPTLAWLREQQLDFPQPPTVTRHFGSLENALARAREYAGIPEGEYGTGASVCTRELLEAILCHYDTFGEWPVVVAGGIWAQCGQRQSPIRWRPYVFETAFGSVTAAIQEAARLYVLGLPSSPLPAPEEPKTVPTFEPEPTTPTQPTAPALGTHVIAKLSSHINAYFLGKVVGYTSHLNEYGWRETFIVADDNNKEANCKVVLTDPELVSRFREAVDAVKPLSY